MHEPFTVSEDAAIRMNKSQKEKERILPMLPRVALLGFGICIFVVIGVNEFIELDLRTSLLCILVPTPMMLAFLCSSPLVARYADSKWTIKEKKIQMSDGFYIPARAFKLWSFSVKESTEIIGYQIITLKSKNGISKAITSKDAEAIARLIEYLRSKGVNQAG